ncbi:MAG: tetratricopeptide repeat protein [Gemmatales bacterium]|nr:tetratricopeptide repeat protein [Gemmatales bacterium]MDW8175488.1 tetratricopeptide repeat protein [Gemmatales bacterium]
MRFRNPYPAYLLALCLLICGCREWLVTVLTESPLARLEVPRGSLPLEQDQPTEALPNSDTVRLLIVHGDKLVERGRDAQALAQYEKARSLQPDCPGLAHKLALLYDRLAQDQKALAEYHRALQQQPNDPHILNDLGYFHYQRGRFAEAEHYFRQALASYSRHQNRATAWLTPTFAHKPATNTIQQRILINLGLALAQQDKLQEAYAAFTQVLPPAQAHYNLAVVLLQRAGHLPEHEATRQQHYRQLARQHLQHALQLDPSLRLARALLEDLDKPRPAYQASPEPSQMDRTRTSLPGRNSPSSSGPPQAPPQGSPRSCVSKPADKPGNSPTTVVDTEPTPIVIPPPPPPLFTIPAAPTATKPLPRPVRKLLRDDAEQP